MALPVSLVNQPSSDEINNSIYDSRQEFLDEDPVSNNGVALFENSFGNTLINAKVLLPQGDKLQNA